MEQCRGLYRLAILAQDLAAKNEGMRPTVRNVEAVGESRMTAAQLLPCALAALAAYYRAVLTHRAARLFRAMDEVLEGGRPRRG